MNEEFTAADWEFVEEKAAEIHAARTYHIFEDSEWMFPSEDTE